MNTLPRVARRRGLPSRRRRGVAAVELAVCAPVLVLLIFGSIQACELIYLHRSLVAAAYEGSLELSRADATNATVSARINQVLALQGVAAGTHTIGASGSAVENLRAGDTVVLTVGAPVGRNLALSGFFVLPESMSAELTCTR